MHTSEFDPSDPSDTSGATSDLRSLVDTAGALVPGTTGRGGGATVAFREASTASALYWKSVQGVKYAEI